MLRPFDSNTARINARKRWDAIKAAKAAKAAPAIAIAEVPLTTQPAKDVGFAATRLRCLHEQLALLDAEIVKEIKSKAADGQRINWLAQAQAKVAEQARALSEPQDKGRLSRAAQRENSRPIPADDNV